MNQDDFPTTGIDDYRLILKRELDSRCTHNPRYSLRAFARDINIAPSRLSEILNYKQGLSRNSAAKIAEMLAFDQEKKDYFCDLVTSIHARSSAEKKFARIRLFKRKSRSIEFQQLQDDTTKILSEWFHFGILELVKLKSFKNNPIWIAKKLKISPIQAKLAVDRLIRVNLLKKHNDMLKCNDSGDFLNQRNISTDAARNFHNQILAKAARAISQHSPYEQEFAANIMAVPREKLAEIKMQIKKFQKSFNNEIDETIPKDSLYCLAIQFFEILNT